MDDSAQLMVKWGAEPVENGLNVNLDNTFDVSAVPHVLEINEHSEALARTEQCGFDSDLADLHIQAPALSALACDETVSMLASKSCMCCRSRR